MAKAAKLTSSEQAALRTVLFEGVVSDQSAGVLMDGLAKLGFGTALSFTSHFYQYAIGRLMNDVVGVQTDPANENLSEDVQGLLALLLEEDESHLADIFKRPCSTRTEGHRSQDSGASLEHTLRTQLRLLYKATKSPLPRRQRAKEHAKQIALLSRWGLLRPLITLETHRITSKGRKILKLYERAPQPLRRTIQMLHMLQWLHHSPGREPNYEALSRISKLPKTRQSLAELHLTPLIDPSG